MWGALFHLIMSYLASLQTLDRLVKIAQLLRTQHWYHVGILYEIVLNLNFEPYNPTRYRLYIFNLVREFQTESHQLLPTSNTPLGLGL